MPLSSCQSYRTGQSDFEVWYQHPGVSSHRLNFSALVPFWIAPLPSFALCFSSSIVCRSLLFLTSPSLHRQLSTASPSTAQPSLRSILSLAKPIHFGHCCRKALLVSIRVFLETCPPLRSLASPRHGHASRHHISAAKYRTPPFGSYIFAKDPR